LPTTLTPTEEDVTTKSKLQAEARPDGAADSEDTDSEARVEDQDQDQDLLAEPEDLIDIDDVEGLEDIADLDGDDAALDDEDPLDIDALEDGDGDDAEVENNVVDVDVLETETPPRKLVAAADGAAEAETDDDELLADEVEASLDVILAERLRGEDLEEEEPEDEGEEDDAPNQLATVIPVRQPDEFLCQSCFLLKPPGQLADRDHQLCRDCA
jgi:hypothetical protein